MKKIMFLIGLSFISKDAFSIGIERTSDNIHSTALTAVTSSTEDQILQNLQRQNNASTMNDTVHQTTQEQFQQETSSRQMLSNSSTDTSFSEESTTDSQTNEQEDIVHTLAPMLEQEENSIIELVNGSLRIRIIDHHFPIDSLDQVKNILESDDNSSRISPDSTQEKLGEYLR